jgi:hypothetical protein
VLFFFEDRYAFGAIHSGLSKELNKHGILGDLINWNTAYSLTEMASFIDLYDYFMTIPSAYSALRAYNIPDEKIILCAHGEEDIIKAVALHGPTMFNRIGGYAVVSQLLVQKSVEYGITRIPCLTPVGINTKNFHSSPSKQLSIVGYAAAMSVTNVFHAEIKRGHLVEECCTKLNIPFVRPGLRHFLGMPQFYRTVDCVIMSSTEETVGLPIMEAAASGRLVIGTKVGHYKDHDYGVKVSLEPKQFVQEAITHLDHYRKDTAAYQLACRDIQDYAMAHFDWSQCIDPWIKMLTKS